MVVPKAQSVFTLPVTFSLWILSGDHWFPQSGRALLQQPIVWVLGSENQLVDLDNSWYMSAAESSGMSRSGGSSLEQSLKGTTVISANTGRVKFTDLRFDRSASCYRITFTLGTKSNGLFVPATELSAVSLPFEVSIGDPWQILMVQQPRGVETGLEIR